MQFKSKLFQLWVKVYQRFLDSENDVINECDVGVLPYSEFGKLFRCELQSSHWIKALNFVKILIKQIKML